ncbi:cob(I)yrinic acid a,c-diamide adenosyltransferase [Candidatus Bipolaricaulota bacterium]|nr:cob(I)yrinic acid a,c-diamide adenosyltransferase [Candidatus Bipolaricaulota bacterium]HBR10327.1 cob(I)yrinic acid a,c-diamide adenosyltransferase [Candidatus Acetothermia bacterium]
MRTRTGLIQVYTGNGKGKTTAAIGLGIRAVGQGLRVHMIQFLKGGDNFPQYGEITLIERLPHFSVEQFGLPHFVDPKKISVEDQRIIDKGVKRARQVLTDGEYDLVILDEINVVLKIGLAKLPVVLKLLEQRKEGVEVVLTGRDALQELIDIADLVSNITEVKHPFTKGVPARKGIEF